MICVMIFFWLSHDVNLFDWRMNRCVVRGSNFNGTHNSSRHLFDWWMGQRVVGYTLHALHNGRMTRSPGGDNQSDVSCATAFCFCSFDEFANVTSVRGGMCVCVCVFVRVCMCDWMFVTDVCRELVTWRVISSVSGLWDQYWLCHSRRCVWWDEGG